MRLLIDQIKAYECPCVYVGVPLDVDVTHVLPGDTRLVQGDVGRVPHDDPQDVPEKSSKEKTLALVCFFPWFSNSTENRRQILY